MSGQLEPFEGAAIRPGHPDFLDLPWRTPLSAWAGRTRRLETMPAGEARHPICFVNYEGRVYALKALAAGAAEREYDLLRQMVERRLPVVQPVGHVATRTEEGEGSVLITRFLDHALPYHSLFLQSGLTRYRDHLLDALAGLLVQLHLAGVYWGDCSLFNTLFLRDAGTLKAYLVDAETSEVHETLSDERRAAELEVMEENVAGALLDLVALGTLPPSYPAAETAEDIRRRYVDLWREISREEVVSPSDRYRIEERVRALNALGFSVGEIELSPAGALLRFRVVVTDRSFHRDLLHSLTGLEVQEMQARTMMNEIHQVRALRSETENRSLSLSGAAYHWLERLFKPTTRRLLEALGPELEPAELYCQVLEHKWYLSEHAQRDVGHDAAATDLIQRAAGERKTS
ncbi:MAG: DUF4032 domain-containing protein [Deltaproteobacteria bacterium]|nr:DUF4032 domain-containing protein [Deltaproteobacteria bacterium]